MTKSHTSPNQTTAADAENNKLRSINSLVADAASPKPHKRKRRKLSCPPNRDVRRGKETLVKIVIPTAPTNPESSTDQPKPWTCKPLSAMRKLRERSRKWNSSLGYFEYEYLGAIVPRAVWRELTELETSLGRWIRNEILGYEEPVPQA